VGSEGGNAGRVDFKSSLSQAKARQAKVGALGEGGSSEL